MKQELDLHENEAVLVEMPGSKYNDFSLSLLKQLSPKKILYVTLNKTADSLMDIFKKGSISADSIVFIDGISKTFMSAPESRKNCSYVRSPGDLTSLSLEITQSLGKCNVVIFDSLTSLLVYEGKAPVARFMSTITARIKSKGNTLIIYALDISEQRSIIEETKMFVDRVVNIQS